MPKKPPIDASSPDTVLWYQGGRTPRDVPARDLSGNELARIAYRREAAELHATRSHLVQPGETRERGRRPEQPDAEALEALATELSATGSFSREAPAQPEPPEEQGPPIEIGTEPTQAVELTEPPPPAAPVDETGGPE